jgi:Rad3-related DNA helicase
MHEIADKIERPVKTYCGGKPRYVERLRMDADDANPFCLSQDEIMEAADYIEALYKELKAAKENAEFHFTNYEAMQKQLERCRKMLEELEE